MAKEVEVPSELRTLLPEEAKDVVLVGSKAYEIFPLTEGQLERIAADMIKVMGRVLDPDRKCPKCNKIFKEAVIRKVTECDICKEWLEDTRQAPLDALVSSSKIPEWVSLVLGIPKEEAQSGLTLNQIKHFAAVFWKQNFSDEGLPEAVKGNFQKLLSMFGIAKSLTAASQMNQVK